MCEHCEPRKLEPSAKQCTKELKEKNGKSCIVTTER